jgi:hypothetical protein
MGVSEFLMVRSGVTEGFGMRAMIADVGRFLSLCSEASDPVSSFRFFLLEPCCCDRIRPWGRQIGRIFKRPEGNTEADTLPSRRLARRGGVKRISAGIYDEIRGCLKNRLELVCPPLPRQPAADSLTVTPIDPA